MSPLPDVLFVALAVFAVLGAGLVAAARRRRRLRIPSRLELTGRGLDDASFVDALTGLLDRRSLERALAVNSLRPEALVGIVMVEIDHFDQLTDLVGRTEAHDTLAAVARLVRAAVGPHGTTYRYGEATLALMLPDVSAELAWEVAEGVRLAVAGTPGEDMTGEGPSGPGASTISLGMALVSRHLLRAVSLADAALYEAKAGGGNRLTIAEVPVELRTG